MDAAPLVLVVEADPELRNVLIDALTWQGYEVVTPRHEGDLRKILRSRPVALVVSDPPSFQGSAAGEGGVHALLTSDPELPVVELADNVPDTLFFRPWSTDGRRRVLRRPFRLSDLLAACRDALGASGPAGPSTARR